jgi:dTDP-glucose 4,6-dehydratase
MVMTRKRVPFSDLPGPINLGNPEEATILNIARKIIDFTGSKSDICFHSMLENDPQGVAPICNGKGLLGMESYISFR